MSGGGCCQCRSRHAGGRGRGSSARGRPGGSLAWSARRPRWCALLRAAESWQAELRGIGPCSWLPAGSRCRCSAWRAACAGCAATAARCGPWAAPPAAGRTQCSSRCGHRPQARHCPQRPEGVGRLRPSPSRPARRRQPLGVPRYVSAWSVPAAGHPQPLGADLVLQRPLHGEELRHAARFPGPRAGRRSHRRGLRPRRRRRAAPCTPSRPCFDAGGAGHRLPPRTAAAARPAVTRRQKARARGSSCAVSAAPAGGMATGLLRSRPSPPPQARSCTDHLDRPARPDGPAPRLRGRGQRRRDPEVSGWVCGWVCSHEGSPGSPASGSRRCGTSTVWRTRSESRTQQDHSPPPSFLDPLAGLAGHHGTAPPVQPASRRLSSSTCSASVTGLVDEAWAGPGRRGIPT